MAIIFPIVTLIWKRKKSRYRYTDRENIESTYACRLRSVGGFFFFGLLLSFRPLSKSQDPIIRFSSIVMQITITNRRQGRSPFRYRGTRISSFSWSGLNSRVFFLYIFSFLPDTAHTSHLPHLHQIRSWSSPRSNTKRQRNRDFGHESILQV